MVNRDAKCSSNLCVRPIRITERKGDEPVPAGQTVSPQQLLKAGRDIGAVAERLAGGLWADLVDEHGTVKFTRHCQRDAS